MNRSRKRLYCMLFASILAGLTTAAVYVRWFRHGLPREVRDALHGSSPWTLVSLEPEIREISSEGPDHKELLHGFIVLGSLPLTDPLPAIEAVEKIDRAYDADRFATCFRPRHALETHMADGRRLELLICYECSQLRWYIDGNQKGILNFPGMDATPLNGMLTAGGIPLPKQAE